MQLQCQMSIESLLVMIHAQSKNAKHLRQEALDDHKISAQTQLLFFQLTDFGYEGKARQCRLLTLCLNSVVIADGPELHIQSLAIRNVCCDP